MLDITVPVMNFFMRDVVNRLHPSAKDYVISVVFHTVPVATQGPTFKAVEELLLEIVIAVIRHGNALLEQNLCWDVALGGHRLTIQFVAVVLQEHTQPGQLSETAIPAYREPIKALNGRVIVTNVLQVVLPLLRVVQSVYHARKASILKDSIQLYA